MPKKKIKDGDIFGEWKVLKSYSSKNKYGGWQSLCRCSCGVEKEINNSNLFSGRSGSCGHAAYKNLGDKDFGKKVRAVKYKSTDEKVLGKTFGDLKVIKRVGQEGRSAYLCKCSCGKEIVVLGNDLLRGNNISCGHIRQEQREIKDKLVEGTSLYRITEGLSKNNTTGYKGVYYDKKLKKYRASLTLNYKKIHLGSYATAEEAYQARLDAEEKYYKPILDRHKDKFEK